MISEGTPTRPGKPGMGVEAGQMEGTINYPPHSRLREAPPKRRLPPFALQQAGKIPSNGVWVFTGRRAWDRARGDIDKPSRLVTLLPLGDDPTAYRWPVAGDEVVVVHTSGESPERLRALGVTLVKQGALRVAIIDTEEPPTLGTMPVFARPVRRAAS